MVSGPFQLFNRSIGEFANGQTDWDANVHMCVLVEGYDIDLTDVTFADLGAVELAAGGSYANQNLNSETVFYNAVGNVSFDAADVTFTNSGSVGPADHIIVVKASNAIPGAGGELSATSALFGVMALDSAFASVSSTSGQFQIQWNTNGLFTLDQTL